MALLWSWDGSAHVELMHKHQQLNKKKPQKKNKHNKFQDVLQNTYQIRYLYNNYFKLSSYMSFDGATAGR